MRKYFNWLSDIGFEFEYEAEKERQDIFEGLAFSLLSFIDEYNIADEAINYLNNETTFWLGQNFKAENVSNVSDEELDKRYQECCRTQRFADIQDIFDDLKLS